MKNSNDTNGNRTRDLPACSAVLQPTALRRTCKHVECVNRSMGSGRTLRYRLWTQACGELFVKLHLQLYS